MKKIIFIKYLYLVLISILYIFGFFFRENIAGGAELDFLNFTWPVIQAFKNDFSETIINYGSYGEGTLPLFHILNAYVNPFSFNEIYFQASIAVISLLNTIFFSKIIEKKYELNKLDSYIFASVFLLLPFFRSSAFWGITENLGWLFLILSIKFYIDYELKHFKNTKIIIFLICLFSSLALYTRPYLIFFPAFLILEAINKKDFIFLKNSALIYFILAIPGLYLIYTWGGIFKIDGGSTNLLKDYHNPKFIFKNLIIFFSIFFFYIIPFEISKVDLKKIVNVKLFFSIFIFIFFIKILNFFNYLQYTNLGGGVFLKLNQLLFGNNIIFFLVISCLAIQIVSNYIFISRKNKLLFLCLLIYCFPKFILQEYFEPLVLIIFLSLLELEKNYKKILKKNRTLIIFCSYYLMYFVGSYYYRYFLV